MEMIQREIEGTVEAPPEVEVKLTTVSQESDILINIQEEDIIEDIDATNNLDEIDPLSEEEISIQNRLNKLIASGNPPILNLKMFNRYQVASKTALLNKVLEHYQPSSITETRDLLQAASSLVGELVGAKKIEPKPKKEP